MKSSKKRTQNRTGSAAKPKPKPKAKVETKATLKSTSKAAPKRKPVVKPRASSTLEILGGPAPAANKPRIAAKWAPQYRRLLSLRDQLVDQAGKLAEEATEDTPNFSMHMADAGTDSFNRDFALSMLSSDQDALYEISEAIKRIENGAYGMCEVTGKPIPKSRLDAIPWARFTAEAQRQLERDGVLKRRQFGAIDSLPNSHATSADGGEEGAGDTDKD